MKIPQIKWAQNDDYILVDIHIEPKDYEIKITNKSVYFKQDDYECNIILHANIIEDESKYSKNRIFEFKLKKEDDYEWAQLLKNKYQYNVSVNWDKWNISDEEDDDMPDMSQMMGGMPDMSQMMGEDVCPTCPDNGECEKCNDEESYEDDFEISSDSEESDEKSEDDKLEESNEEEPDNHPVFDKECGDEESDEKSEDKNTD